MTYDEIYEIVKANKNISELKEQLQGVFLDVLDDKSPFLTVAGKLAAENDKNDIEKVEKLRELGAAPQFIAMGYAIAGNHEKVAAYRDLHPACVPYIVIGYALVGNHKQVKQYREKYPAIIDTIAEAYALAGNDKKVKHYLMKYPTVLTAVLRGYALANNQDKIREYLDVYFPQGHIPVPIREALLQGYALSNNHKMVEFLRLQGCSVDVIAHCYALIGNDVKAKEYYEKHKASPTAIATGYVRINNHKQVDYYHSIGANPANIAAVYELIGNHEKAESYRSGNSDNSGKVSVDEIADVNAKSENASPLYQAIDILKARAEGPAVIKIMLRLKKGEDSKWNPYWMNSKTKLEGIVNVINKQEAGFDLAGMLNDKTSDLYKAINWSRISKFTIFGAPHWNESKSLSAIKSMVPSLNR